jgi:hypothetical protein
MLGFVSTGGATVAGLIGDWLSGREAARQTPPLGASLFGYLLSLVHRAEIDTREPGQIPNPLEAPDAFQAAVTSFYALFHDWPGGLPIPTDRERATAYGSLLIDPLGWEDWKFVLQDGVAPIFPTLALPPGTPTPPRPLAIKRVGWPTAVPVVWLMRLLGGPAAT